MNKYPEHQLVQKCLHEIEAQLEWGSASTWHNDVFTELSEKIHQETEVLLSPTTLKRVWGKINYKSAPSISTLNTLSQFAGYANWRDFKIKADRKKPFGLEQRITKNLGVIMASAAVMTIVFISFYSMIGPGTNKRGTDFSDLSFKSHSTAEGVPNTVIFDFDLKNIKSDQIYIQQYWDKTKTIKIRPNQEQATGIYYFPGYFKAKLVVDENIVSEHDLFIPSNGWLGTLEYSPVPKYIKHQDLVEGQLAFPDDIVEEIKSSEEALVSVFHYVKDFGKLSGDNLVLKTAIRQVYQEKWAVCQTTRIVILGTTGALIIPFSIPGCVSDIGLMLNDVYLNGKEKDLSTFGTDFSEYRAIEIAVKERAVTISIDGKRIYAGQYNDSIGHFVGIRYKFLGAGEVGQLSIEETSTGNMIIEEDFKTNQ